MEKKRQQDPNNQKGFDFGIIADFASIFNGITGIIAIYAVSIGLFYLSVRLMSFGVLLDALDGYLARKSKLTGPRKRGIYLDSICDGITFGLFPALLYLALYPHTLFVIVSAGIYVAFTWYRLARYTQDADIDRFKGLPSPGGAAITSSLLILYKLPTNLSALFIVAIAALMASQIPYPSFKKPKGLDKILQSGTGIVTGLFVIFPSSIGIYPLIILFILSVIYVLIGPFWVKPSK